MAPCGFRLMFAIRCSLGVAVVRDWRQLVRRYFYIGTSSKAHQSGGSNVNKQTTMASRCQQVAQLFSISTLAQKKSTLHPTRPSDRVSTRVNKTYREFAHIVTCNNTLKGISLLFYPSGNSLTPEASIVSNSQRMLEPTISTHSLGRRGSRG